MKKTIQFLALFATLAMFSQAGHIMQGVGAINMSMGGAATGQPLDISGALLWNPAAISHFDGTVLKADVGLFFSSPELRSTVPVFNSEGQPTGEFFSGITEDDRGLSPMPALALVWGKNGSPHTFGVSAFGISGFGVTFPENNLNPINASQSMGGFGRIESDYGVFQFGVTWSYQIAEGLSIAIQPNFNWAMLELMPNPTANPTLAGYPSTNKASAIGFGAQAGLFYESNEGFSFGLSYKSQQNFQEFEFENTYLDGQTSSNTLDLDYPAIYSAGIGYSIGDFDIAFDFRYVDYENTNGFSESGWTDTGSVAGFGWKNIQILSTGLQFRGIDKLPLRIGYTYSSNPIDESVAFFNVPATAIIENAFQFGMSYKVSEQLQFDGVFHYATSNGDTSGPLLNPMFIQNYPPYGAIPGSSVSYEMTTSMVMLGASYSFNTVKE
ncbi:MAG TPA: outer membrane protein transport protein [Flavobacteriaceae bacterium]|nr:outer membrane protein transport protein [Flavobacteriaceae bacterium]MCB9212458.1 outer membrane protein transport protein [Alteromonas sp.]HPF10521.1 outer membrane protein transport protein [Flavobacteriaceae bacterium]HQU20209.1 outer membrane protein transport protein [Flavobacteriaceae bacterium]HQU64702.1 outer membrane protein transport protein [Flavobacteriaceae bacterium]